MPQSPRPLITSSDGTARILGATDIASLVELLRECKIPEGREDAVHDMALASHDQVKASNE